MSQLYKSHPFDIAIRALAPVFAPSFFLRAPRDRENLVDKYPLIDYVIIGGDTKVYDRNTNQWRATFSIQLDVLIKETKPLSWCDFDELKDAQDRNALYYHFEQMIQDFLTLLINPTRAVREFRSEDLIYSNFDFRLEAYIATRYWNKHGKDKLTGISSRFSLSALSGSGGCCIVDDTAQQWQRLQDLTITDSVSYRLIENKINP